MISLKDYAAQKNVSYEAIRKQVARYRDELEDHIVVDGRQMYLDDEAVAFLDEKRQKNPVIVYQQSKDEEIAALRSDKEQLIMKTAEMAMQIADLTQFKLETIERRQIQEATTAQQALREKELDAREQAMDQRITEACQEASETARKAADEEWGLRLAEAQEKAQNELTEAQNRHEEELRQEQNRFNSMSIWEFLKEKRKKGKG
jgi:hypothetical protein